MSTYYVLNFDGNNIKIVAQGDLSSAMRLASLLKVRINGNDSIVVGHGSTFDVLMNKGVYNK